MTGGSSTDVRVRVVHRRRVARSIVEFRLAAPRGRRLPACRTGAHIEVVTPAGSRRNYSVTSAGSSSPDHYDIAVALSPDSTGGSRSMHTDVRVGDVLTTAPPRGGMDLPPGAGDLLLLAGGVGITPLRPVYHAARAAGRHVRMVQLVRSRRDAAYVDEFDPRDATCHASDEHDGRRFDLWQVLERPADTWVYCCGPQALLSDVKALTMHWRASRLHFEDFSGVSALDAFGSAFTARWAPTGATYRVDASETLLDRLEAAGIGPDSSCRAGTCGTCEVRVHDGVVLHRDVSLSAEARRHAMLPCVSRAEGTVTIGPRLHPPATQDTGAGRRRDQVVGATGDGGPGWPPSA